MAFLAPAGGAGMNGAPDSLSIVAEERDREWTPWIVGTCAEGMEKIHAFFGMPLARGVQVRVFPDRAALTAYWRSAWGIPDLQTECWQVASGTRLPCPRA